jgi:hypothetical protein
MEVEQASTRLQEASLLGVKPRGPEHNAGHSSGNKASPDKSELFLTL